MFPTETVYGLWADALSDESVEKIFVAKKRPPDNPLIVHLASTNMIDQYAVVRNRREKRIIESLMPWPLTIVLESKGTISRKVRAFGPTVAIRVPSHTIAHDFLTQVGLPVAAPSANVSGRPSATNKDMVQADLADTVEYIIDWWLCEYGIESTVVKVVGEKVLILRPWFITKEDIELALWDDTSVLYSEKLKEQSPGTRYQHYTPKIPVYEYHTIKNLLSWSNHNPHSRSALVLTNETYYQIKDSVQDVWTVTYFARWSSFALHECAHNLYNIYFQAEKDGFDCIRIESLPMQWLWLSIMNRVKKSITVQ